MKEKTEGGLKKWDKYKYVALVVLAGVLLMLWPDSGERQTAREEPLLPADHLQEELEETLSRIDGVGEARVLLTTAGSARKQLAQNTDLRYSGNSLEPEDYQRSSEILLGDGLSGGEPLVIQTLYPTYRGAVVVCPGGDRAEVKLAVTQAVSAVTGLTSDRISVAKCQSSYGGGRTQ